MAVRQPFILLLFARGAMTFIIGDFQWSIPAFSGSNDGLGGGLGFVVDQDFCSNLLQRFPERDIFHGLDVPWLQFVHCSDIYHALQRGFRTWSENHRRVSFADLSRSAACKSRPTAELDDACPWELFIGTSDGKENENLAAFVINHRRSHVDKAWRSKIVRSSSGVEKHGRDALARSVMRFQTHLCWYLDATFCYYFQVLQEKHGVDIFTLVRIVLIFIFGAAAMRLCSIIFWSLVALFCVRDRHTALPPPDADESTTTSSTRAAKGSSNLSACTACLNYLSSLSPCCNLVVLFAVCFPPLFYEKIFLPCWECFDFEAVVAHETGHVLGFGHPDQSPEANQRAKCRLTNATCRDPFNACATASEYDVATDPSIMHSLTRRAARTCLSQADFDGLHLLYPICDGLQPTGVACTKGRVLSGWLRLAVVVGVPFLICVVAILLPLTCLRWRDRRRMRRLDRQLGHAHNSIRQYRVKLKEAMEEAVRERARAAMARPASAVSLQINKPGSALLRLRQASSRIVSNVRQRSNYRVHPMALPPKSNESGQLVRVQPPQLRPARTQSWIHRLQVQAKAKSRQLKPTPQPPLQQIRSEGPRQQDQRTRKAKVQKAPARPPTKAWEEKVAREVARQASADLDAIFQDAERVVGGV